MEVYLNDFDEANANELSDQFAYRRKDIANSEEDGDEHFCQKEKRPIISISCSFSCEKGD